MKTLACQCDPCQCCKCDDCSCDPCTCCNCGETTGCGGKKDNLKLESKKGGCCGSKMKTIELPSSEDDEVTTIKISKGD